MILIAGSVLQLSYERIKELDINIVEYPLFVNGEPYPVSVSMSGEEKDKLRDLIKPKLSDFKSLKDSCLLQSVFSVQFAYQFLNW